jgi:hypothetical protein
MAIEYVRDVIASGYNLSKINDNFAKIEQALQDAVSRSGEGPNAMASDLDLNSNDLLNAGTVDTNTLILNGNPVVPADLSFIPPNIIGSAQIIDKSIQAIDIADDTLVDSLLSSTSNVGRNNLKITSVDQWNGSIETMFAQSSYMVYLIPAGIYTFDAVFTIPANSIIIAENGTIFQPTFEPVGVARATPLITVSSGVVANYLKLSLPAGIDTIRIGFKIGSNCQIGYIEAVATDFNINRIEGGSTDLISGAVLIQDATQVRIGQMLLSKFDRGWSVVNCTDVIIEKVRNLETLMGGYVQETRDLHVMSAFTTSLSAANATALSRPRGPMTPGLNSVVLAGCSDSTFGLGGGWQAFDILEHGIRVGAAIGAVPNQRISFGAVKIYRSYGCGFKCDDADAFNIKKVTIESLYTEDVGRGNWFGTPGYQNWASNDGTNYINTPLVDNDGNKEACAIRNSQFVIIRSFMNRASGSTVDGILMSESGYIGLWIERSNHVFAYADTEKSRTAGIQIQSGGTTSPENITVKGRTSNNLGAGVKFEASASDAVWRGVEADVDSQDNGTYDFEVTANQSGGSPFATRTSRIKGFALGGASGIVNIAAVVLADTSDFVDEVVSVGTFTPSISFATPGDLVLSSVTATGFYKRVGRYVKIEFNFTGTPTFTTATGNLRLTGLPFPAASANGNFTLQLLTALIDWNSRTMLAINPTNANTFCEIRGMVPAAGVSPIQSTEVTSGAALTINFSGEYRI